MDERTIIYLSATSVVALLVIFGAASYQAYSIAVIVLALATIVAILMINYADFLIFPAITNMLKIQIIPAKNYYIPKTNNCVIKYVNGLYYATGYLTANIYSYIFQVENLDADEEQKLSEAPDKWESIVMNVDFPFRFNMVAAAEDIQKYRDELEGKRGMLEYQLSKEMQNSNPSQMTVQELQRKMNVLDVRINKLSTGERPVSSIMYIETVAVGVSEKEAMDSLTNQLSHLETLFNTFDLSITRVIGRELYHLFTFGYALPFKGVFGQMFGAQS